MKRSGFVNVDGKEYYKISNCDKAETFLFTLAQSNDIWIYLSSNGKVTAGRKNSGEALFPYVSEDKLYSSTDSGVKTLIRVSNVNGTYLWQPFSDSYTEPYSVERNLYKSITGGTAIFEEINRDLGISFKYKWQCCEKYGIVKTAYIENIGNDEVKVEVMDGFINVLPYGIKPVLQANWSCLGDGYKKTEIVESTNAVIFALTMSIADTPSPEELLKANLVWSISNFETDIFIEEKSLKAFAQHKELISKDVLCGERGAYLMRFEHELKPHKAESWRIIADVGLSQVKITDITEKIKTKSIKSEDIETELNKSEEELKTIIAKADGLQCTGDKMSTVHHMSNVAFNNMRGGLFLDNYSFAYNDFIRFIKTRNKRVYEKYTEFFEAVKEISSVIELKKKAKATGNTDLIRLCLEYLPISFSRRHGDPSRPWNAFSIVLKNPDGTPVTNYEGNWRDIFQNWEAMCLSFPEYFDSVIAKFLNASTPDGFNPYKITTAGIEWEYMNPDDPCPSMGYWGDHQIIYLTRLLEWLKRYNKNHLDFFVNNNIFAYANVPYEIVSFDKLISDPEHTINHNMQKDKAIIAMAEECGTDHKLVMKNDSVYHVSFAEKLIVPVLSKISNLVIGGGIWMNTQRPEWNDANNAIVGYGLSVVTVCHLKRHLILCRDILEKYSDKSVEITAEVLMWLSDVVAVLRKYLISITDKNVSGKTRMAFLADMGRAFDEYKNKIYNNGFTIKEKTEYKSFIEFFDLTLDYIDYTIKVNKRNDGLYNSYNLIELNGEEIEIRNLKPMLEGQVAVLSCDFLSGVEVESLLNAMEKSELYSERDKTYYLYPIVHTKRFMEKNIITDKMVSQSELIKRLLSDGNRQLVEKDSTGNVRFNYNLYCKDKLKEIINILESDVIYSELSKTEREKIFAYYEQIFKHSEYMGRSQALYKYEGIGSVYWHQNSKLLVSVQERMLNDRDRLYDWYYRVRNGLGFNKNPDEWGAFPIDAYSHTPYNGGAKQPGMTGQVKEEIIARFTELGLIIKDGMIEFDYSLVHESEYLKEPAEFEFIGVNNSKEKISLGENSLAFTFCQTPIIYKSDGKSGITVKYSDEKEKSINSYIMTQELSSKIFKRTGDIKSVTVHK